MWRTSLEAPSQKRYITYGATHDAAVGLGDRFPWWWSDLSGRPARAAAGRHARQHAAFFGRRGEGVDARRRRVAVAGVLLGALRTAFFCGDGYRFGAATKRRAAREVHVMHLASEAAPSAAWSQFGQKSVLIYNSVCYAAPPSRPASMRSGQESAPPTAEKYCSIAHNTKNETPMSFFRKKQPINRASPPPNHNKMAIITKKFTLPKADGTRTPQLFVVKKSDTWFAPRNLLVSVLGSGSDAAVAALRDRARGADGVAVDASSEELKVLRDSSAVGTNASKAVLIKMAWGCGVLQSLPHADAPLLRMAVASALMEMKPVPSELPAPENDEDDASDSDVDDEDGEAAGSASR